jgi:hypothetical protein
LCDEWIVVLGGAIIGGVIAALETPVWINVLAALSPLFLALLAGVGWLYRHERERRASVERQLSEHKYGAYIELLNIFFDMFKATRKKTTMPQTKLVDRMTDANKDLMIYGSDDVALTYQRWMEKARRGHPVLRDFGEVVIAIRRDMGNPKTRMTPDDVLRQLIVDYDGAKAQGII